MTVGVTMQMRIYTEHDFIEVSDDEDGLDLIEIQQVNKGEETGPKLVMTIETARALMNEIERVCVFIENRIATEAQGR